MRLQCRRISCITDEVTIETHRAITYMSSVLGGCIRITPGVTGYESFSIADMLKRPKMGDWYACAGTKGMWDTLIVPKEEMEKLVDILELLPLEYK